MDIGFAEEVIVHKNSIKEDNYIEKKAIQSWMVQKKTNPITREELLPHLYPNLSVKNEIDDWKKAYRKAKTEVAIKTKVEVDDS